MKGSLSANKKHNCYVQVIIHIMNIVFSPLRTDPLKPTQWYLQMPFAFKSVLFSTNIKDISHICLYSCLTRQLLPLAVGTGQVILLLKTACCGYKLGWSGFMDCKDPCGQLGFMTLGCIKLIWFDFCQVMRFSVLKKKMWFSVDSWTLWIQHPHHLQY